MLVDGRRSILVRAQVTGGRRGGAGQERERPEVGEVAGRRCRHFGAERGSGAARIKEAEDLVLKSSQAGAGRAAPAVLVEPGPAAGRVPSPVRGNLRAALGGMQPGCQHRGQQGAAGPSFPDSLAALGAEVLQQPLVDGAGEDDGQVPGLEPGSAERLLDSRPVAGEAFGAVARCRGEDEPPVKAPGASCLAFGGGDDGRVALAPGAHAEPGGLGAGEPG